MSAIGTGTATSAITDMQFYDRILERSYSGGVGNIQLSGRLATYFAFGDYLNDGEQQYVCIEDEANDDLEIALCQYVQSSNQLQRLAVVVSSNGGLPVNFTSGSAKRVYSVCTAEKINELFAHVQDKHYTHTQSTPAAQWDIAHGLGKEPSVTVVDSTGRVVVGQVDYLTQDAVRITFQSAFSGQAHLN